MKKIVFILTLVVIFGISVLAEATLWDRGGGLIYCDTLDITLLQNANFGAGSSYDDGDNATDGKMNWDNAQDWADNLVYGGYDDWRLPSASNQNGSVPNQGYNVLLTHQIIAPLISSHILEKH